MTTEDSDPKEVGVASTDDPKSGTRTQSKAQGAAESATEAAQAASDQGETSGADRTGGDKSAADKAAADKSAADKPGVKPPWQRANDLTPETGGGARSVPKKKKPIITGTAAPKLDESAEPAGTDGDRFVESPTRSIGRSQVKAKDLPNLDEIHAAATAPRGGAPAGQRSAPTQVGTGGTGASRALRATVQIRRIDPWSTLKVSAILAVIGFFIWMIAVAVLYLVLDGMGVWSQVNSSVGTLTTDGGGAADAIGAGTVFGWAFLIGVVDAILLTALASLGAFIYTLCADFIGGVEVTLADLD